MIQTLRIWAGEFRLIDLPPESVAELHESFAGAIERRDDAHADLTIRRLPSVATIAAPGARVPRHRAGYGSTYYFLDGRVFDASVQQRDIDILFEDGPVSGYRAGAALLLSTRAETVILGEALPPMLLSDIVENWLLWSSREQHIVMAHGSSWVRDGRVEMLAADSGGGKTTELFRQIQLGARFFSNDRVALRLAADGLEARSFPQPVNVGFGTIRSLRLDLPTFDEDPRNKLRLRAAEVAARFRPDYASWLPLSAVFAESEEQLLRNVHWDGDRDHPFWNRALPPSPLRQAEEIRARLLRLVRRPPM